MRSAGAGRVWQDTISSQSSVVERTLDRPGEGNREVIRIHGALGTRQIIDGHGNQLDLVIGPKEAKLSFEVAENDAQKTPIGCGYKLLMNGRPAKFGTTRSYRHGREDAYFTTRADAVAQLGRGSNKLVILRNNEVTHRIVVKSARSRSPKR